MRQISKNNPLGQVPRMVTDESVKASPVVGSVIVAPVVGGGPSTVNERRAESDESAWLDNEAAPARTNETISRNKRAAYDV